MKSRFLLPALASTILAITIGAPTVVHAALLAEETFSSYPAPSNLAGANGGTGWLAGWSVGFPGDGFRNEVRNNVFTPTYPGYNGSTTPAASGGNYVNIFSEPFNFAIRTLDVADEFSAYNDGGLIGADNTTLWGSMLYSVTDGNGHLRLRDNADVDRVDISLLSGANHLIVFRLNFGVNNVDTISIFDDPSLPFNPASAPSRTLAGDLSFSKFYIFRDTANGELRVDDIRFGSTAADVAPVPEPATGSLLALSAAALLARRRSRNHRA